MNAAVAMQAGVGFGSLTIIECLKALGEQFAFLLGPSSHDTTSEKQDLAPHEIAQKIIGVLDQLVIQTIKTRSRDDFVKVRALNFPEYFGAVRTLSGIARILMSDQARAARTEESFARLEALLSQDGAVFGEDVREQALFTVWTFRKIDSLIREILRNDAPKDCEALDSKFAQDFAFHILWARFHLDCLTVSLQSNIRISQDARDAIMDGLRAAVNAHAYAKQGARLRRNKGDDASTLPEWDDEQRALLDASMEDLEEEENEYADHGSR